MNRRQLMAISTGMVFVATSPLPGHALPGELDEIRRELFGDRPINQGRVTLELPPIAENGFSVPLSVHVDSQMSANNYVSRIVILSPRNPIPLIAQYHLTPKSGRASVVSRIRLSGTQAIQAVAEMSDGTLWSGSKDTVVTLAACVVL